MNTHVIAQIYKYAQNNEWKELQICISSNSPNYHQYLFRNLQYSQFSKIFVNKKPPFHFACKYGTVDLIQWFILKAQYPAYLNLDFNGQTPLDAALENKKLEIVEILVKKINITGPEFALKLCKYKYWHLVKRFTDRNFIRCIFQPVTDSTERTSTPLHLIASTGSADLLEHILARRDDNNVNITDSDGKTALTIALQKNQWDQFTILFKNGGKIRPCDLDAISRHNLWDKVGEIIKEVDNTSIFVNSGYIDFLSPLHYISGYCTSDVLEHVLSNSNVEDINIDVQDADNKTPLFYAAELGSDETVRLLLQYGANLSMNGEPALNIPIVNTPEPLEESLATSISFSSFNDRSCQEVPHHNDSKDLLNETNKTNFETNLALRDSCSQNLSEISRSHDLRENWFPILVSVIFVYFVLCF